MKKSIEEAAREYTDKIASKSGYCPWDWDDVENSYLAGYARAIDEASEGFEEWEASINKPFVTTTEVWTAARLSSQKELAELEVEQIFHIKLIQDECNAEIKELEEKLKVVEKIANYSLDSLEAVNELLDEEDLRAMNEFIRDSREALAKIQGEQKDTDNEL